MMIATIEKTSPTCAQQRRALLWRLHLWAALIASPFLLAACITGMLYVLTPTIERMQHGHLDTVAVPQGAAPRLYRPLDEAVAAAQAVAPEGWRLFGVVPAFETHQSVRVAFMPPPRSERSQASGHDHHAGAAKPASRPEQGAFLRPTFGIPTRAWVVYVNPYTAQVLGTLVESDRFAVWARKLHSQWQQGDGWRWMIELAASWTLVMLITGVFLWWPRGQASGGVGARVRSSRLRWRQWHVWVGLSLSAISASILITGLTWSQYAGDQIKWLRDATGQTSPRIPARIHSQSVGRDVPMLSWQAAWEAVQREAPTVAALIMPPQGEQGVWRAQQMDASQPTLRYDLLLDAYTGERLYRSGWAEQTLFGKATTVGIPFHRGELGLWNRILLLMFGGGLIFSTLSGWAMVWKRYRAGLAFWPTLPAGAWRSVPIGAWLAGMLGVMLMPLWALSWVLVWGVELAVMMRRN